MFQPLMELLFTLEHNNEAKSSHRFPFCIRNIKK